MILIRGFCETTSNLHWSIWTFFMIIIPKITHKGKTIFFLNSFWFKCWFWACFYSKICCCCFSVAKCWQNCVICIEICKQNVCILANMSQLLPKMMFQTHFCCFFLNQIYDLTTRKSCTRFSLLYNKIYWYWVENGVTWIWNDC